MLSLVPEHRINETIVFDCGDRQHPVGFNPLRCDSPEQRPLVADGVLSAFKHVFGLTEAEAPRLTYILRCALLTLLETPGTTLLDLDRLLGDSVFQRRLIERVGDPVVRAFWVHHFLRWRAQERREATASIVNKVGHFTTNPLTRAILCQADAKLDLRRAMDGGAAVIVNLSKGRLGEASANLLGALFVSSLQLAAMGRAEIPPEDRRPFFVILDEFQKVAAAGTMESLLGGARKFGLGLACLHQNLEQLSEEVQAAVFANTGSLAAFAVGSRDAEPPAEQFARKLAPTDLIRLPQFHCYMRLLLAGQPTRPFSVRTLPPPAHGSREVAATVRRVSQRRFAQPLVKVEAAIQRVYGAA